MLRTTDMVTAVKQAQQVAKLQQAVVIWHGDCWTTFVVVVLGFLKTACDTLAQDGRAI